MSKYAKMAGPNGLVVAAYEIFFVDEKAARARVEKYGGELQKLDDGWLVKKEPEPASDDDPIIQAIKKAIEEDLQDDE